MNESARTPTGTGNENPGSNQQQAVFLSRRQVAERWACCSHTIARRRDLRPVRFNRRLLRYRLADIIAVEAAGAA